MRSISHSLKSVGRLLLAIFAVAAALCSCGKKTDAFQLRGSMAGINTAEFYVYAADGNGAIDTVRIEDGDFTYERTVAEPTILVLLYPNFTQTYIVAEPGTTAKMKGDAGRLSEADIHGSEENELLTEFRLKWAGKPKGQVRDAAADFIRHNAAHAAATALFLRYFAAEENPEATVAMPLLAALEKAQPQSSNVAFASQLVRPRMKTARGAQMPDFTWTTVEGSTVSRADFAGRPYIIVYWSTWTDQTFTLMRELRAIRRAYGSRLGIVYVSLDVNIENAKARAQRDSIGERFVCDGLALASPTARDFGVRYVPSCIAVNKAGKIVGRDVEATALKGIVEGMMK